MQHWLHRDRRKQARPRAVGSSSDAGRRSDDNVDNNIDDDDACARS